MSQGQVLEVLEKYNGKVGLTTQQIHVILVTQGIVIEKNTVSTNLSKLCRAKLAFKYYERKRNEAPKYVTKDKLTEKIKKKIENSPDWWGVK